MRKITKLIAVTLIMAILTGALFAQGTTETTGVKKPEVTLKYAHMNVVDNTSGKYAQFFADRVFELTKGAVLVEIYPNSQLGSIQEMAEMVSAGTVQLHHNTWGGLAVLMEKLELMDTPYLTASISDAIKLNDITKSPVLIELNEEFKKTANVRILASIYGGSRMLTTSGFPVYSPKDLNGVKIRAIPAKVYITAVKGMGAIPIAVDWADTPTALATGVAQGQENPPVTIYTAKLQETQKYLMETRHITAIGPMVMNEKAYQALKPEYQKAIDQAAYETWEKYNQVSIDSEMDYIKKLVAEGMTFITKADGLKVDEFKASVDALVAETYSKYAPYYARIKEYLGY